MALHPLAAVLNGQIAGSSPMVLAALSLRGRLAYFPSKGILGQAGEARGRRINATIGIALEEDGTPMRLEVLEQHINLPATDTFTYAPSFGKPALRTRWQEMIQAKNPGLGGVEISLPVATVALTHALSMAGYLFADPGDRIISPHLFWGNYRLIFEQTYGAQIETYETFTEGGFNVAGLRQSLMSGPPGRRIVLLNFPNNPTGYTPTPAEADAITAVLVDAAKAGHPVVALIDDAYFGLIYEKNLIRESIFTRLANAHEGLLAVKIDGATKEDYAWGFRVGFMTFGIKGGNRALYAALENKLAGAVRATVSNAPHLSQSLILSALNAPEYAMQKKAKHEILAMRYRAIKRILATRPEYAESFTPMPFNSGYFMCLRLNGVEPEVVRKILLEKYDTGVIATAGLLRVAFSSAPFDLLEDLFQNIHRACGDAR